MIVNVKVTAKAKRNEIIKIDDKNFKVKVTAAPEKGKANEAVRELLAREFGVGKSMVRIVGGVKSRNKVLAIFV